MKCNFFFTAQVREAEEARAREKARREAEAKKHAKTRVLMSSLFDKVRVADPLHEQQWHTYSLVVAWTASCS